MDAPPERASTHVSLDPARDSPLEHGSGVCGQPYGKGEGENLARDDEPDLVRVSTGLGHDLDCDDHVERNKKGRLFN